MTNKLKSCTLGLITMIFMVLADQFTKYLAITNLKDQEPFVLLKNIFELHYLENRGAAFGILQGQKMVFVVMTILILAVIGYCYIRIPHISRYLLIRIIMILFAAGAIGNFIDRIFRNYVVDFFYFSLINFPIFNVADIYVTIAAFLMILSILFYYKEKDCDEMIAAIKPGRHTK